MLSKVRILPIVWVLLLLIAVPIVAFRVFGLIYFDTPSGWAYVPAAVLIVLFVLQSVRADLVRQLGVLLTFATYTASGYFHILPHIAKLNRSGIGPSFEIAEALVVLGMSIICLLPSRKTPP